MKKAFKINTAMLKRLRTAFASKATQSTSSHSGQSASSASTGENAQPDDAPSTGSGFGFKIVQGRSPAEQEALVQALFDDEINPQVASHAGNFALLAVRDNSVYVRMEGRCQGCSMASVTLRQAVEHRLREVLPEMIDLVDETNHGEGSNPYFAQGKK